MHYPLVWKHADHSPGYYTDWAIKLRYLFLFFICGGSLFLVAEPDGSTPLFCYQVMWEHFETRSCISSVVSSFHWPFPSAPFPHSTVVSLFALTFIPGPVYVKFVKDRLANGQFWDAFTQFRKATVSFVMSVRPSIRLSACNNSDSTGRIFMKFDIWVFF